MQWAARVWRVVSLALLLVLGSAPGFAHDLVSPALPSRSPSANEAPTPRPSFGAEIAARTGGTIALELGRAGAVLLVPALTRVLARGMAPGAAGITAAAIATTGTYMAYKAGWDLISANFSAPGQPERRFDPLEVVAVGVGAAAGSAIGRCIHPLIGAWLGEWFGWVLAESIVTRWRKTGQLDIFKAATDIDGWRVALAAVATEATGRFVFQSYGLTSGMATPGVGLKVGLTALAAKILAMSFVKTSILRVYDRDKERLQGLKPAKPREAIRTLEAVGSPPATAARSGDDDGPFADLRRSAGN